MASRTETKVKPKNSDPLVEPSAQEVVPLESTAGWSFYDTAEQLHEAYADYDRRSERNAV